MYIEGADENLLQLEGSHSEPVIQGSRRINLHISGMLVYNIAHDDGIQITIRELFNCSHTRFTTISPTNTYG